MLLKEIDLHKEQMSTLESRAEEMNEPIIESLVGDLSTRYNTLLDNTTDNVAQLEEQVNSHDKYRTSYKNSMDSVIQIRQKLQHLTDPVGSKNELQSRLNKLDVSTFLLLSKAF